MDITTLLYAVSLQPDAIVYLGDRAVELTHTIQAIQASPVANNSWA